MARGKQRNGVRYALARELPPLPPRQNVFHARATNARLHQARGRRAQDDFPMIIDMVGVGVTDEDALNFRIVWVEPQPQGWQIDAAAMKLNLQRGR